MNGTYEKKNAKIFHLKLQMHIYMTCLETLEAHDINSLWHKSKKPIC